MYNIIKISMLLKMRPLSMMIVGSSSQSLIFLQDFLLSEQSYFSIQNEQKFLQERRQEGKMQGIAFIFELSLYQQFPILQEVMTERKNQKKPWKLLKIEHQVDPTSRKKPPNLPRKKDEQNDEEKIQNIKNTKQSHQSFNDYLNSLSQGENKRDKENLKKIISLDVVSHSNEKERKKSIESGVQFEEQQNEPMILSILRGKYLYKNDPKLTNLREAVKELKEFIGEILLLVAQSYVKFAELTESTVRNIIFKMNSETVQKSQKIQQQKNPQQSINAISNSIAFQDKGKDHFELQQLLKENQRLNESLEQSQNQIRQLKSTITTLKSDNENLSQAVFDYGQKIAQLDLEFDKITKHSSKQRMQEGIEETYLKQIHQLKTQIQVLNRLHRDQKLKLDVALQNQQHNRNREQRLSIREYNVEKWGKDLDLKANQLQSQYTRIKEKETELRVYESQLQQYETQLQIRKSQINHYKDEQYFNVPRKNYHFSQVAKQSMRSASPKYRYKVKGEGQKPLNKSRSIEKDKMSIRSPHNISASQKLSEVGTKLQKLRIEIRKEINLIK